MAAGLSTFAQTEQKFEAAEQQTAQPNTETSTTTVAPDGNLESTQPATQETTQQTTEQAAPAQTDESSSAFKFDVGEETAPAQEKTETASTTPVFNLDEELKKVDRKELLKKAGVNDFAIELDEYLAKGGKAADYLNAKSIDYNQVSDEDLIKDDFKKQYPNLTKDDINRLYNRKYGVTEDMLDEEREDRLLQLKADGYLKRQSKIAEQQKFVIPDNPIIHKDEAYEQWKIQQDSIPEAMNILKNFYDTHEATKSLYESKRVAINLGENVPSFNFTIDQPEFLTKMWTDGGTILQKMMSNQSGEPDVAKQYMVGLFAANPNQFVRDIFNYGKQMGIKSKVDEGQNAQKPQQKVLPAEMNGQASYSTGKFGDKQRN